ncbi:MAG: type VI secretion system contractile sheath large subunit [Planctomycetes bacterium]|nr:type VI secretion system contractile sheath large subunit [Planctomycetota bacterium]
MSDDKRVKGFEGSFGFGPSDHPEVKPLPFRIMAVGNFCGANRSEARNAAAVDAYDFDKVMSQFWPRAVFEVESHLGPSTGSGQAKGKDIEIDFTPQSLKDFEPGAMAARIKALAPVADFIARAKGLADGSVKPADFKRDLAPIQAVPALRDALDAVLDKIGGAPASASTSDGDTGDKNVDAIFDMVEQKKPATGSAIDSFAAGLGGGKSGIDVGDAIGIAQKLLEKQLRPVLDDPQVRALERNWRGLHALCKRGKGAKIEVFDGDFDSWQEQVFNAELAGTSEAPLGMVVLCDDIENSPAGMDALQQWGDAGGQIQCPVVFDATNLLGESTGTLAGRDAPANLFDDTRFDKWRSLRDKDESRWLVAALNPFVLRAKYTRKKHGMDAPELWGSPAWLVAAVVAGSMERTGWPASHTGASAGEVTALPTIEHDDGVEHPLEATFSERGLKDLVKSGFTPLIAQPNNDAAWVLLAPTVHKPSKAEEEGKLGTLAYQLLAARLGEMIMRNKGKLVVPGNMQGSAENFGKFLGGLLAETGPGANVDISAQGGTLVLRIRTGRELLGGAEIQLGVNVE